jgi:hypothetical protein
MRWSAVAMSRMKVSKAKKPETIEAKELEAILATHNEKLPNRTKAIAEKVKKHGYKGLNGHDFFIAIAENYFGSRNGKPTRSGERADIGETIFDCCENILETVLIARPIRVTLKKVLDELDCVLEARPPKRGPISNRIIAQDTLSLIAGITPKSLQPDFKSRPEDGVGRSSQLFTNTLAGAVKLPKGLKWKRMPRQTAEFTVSENSEILAGKLHSYSATDTPIGFLPLPRDPWPISLAALGFEPGEPIVRGVRISSILRLSHRHLRDLKLRCARVRWELGARFGIRNRNDPLNISAVDIFAQPPMAKLMNCLCNLIAPFPAIKILGAYNVILSAPAWREAEDNVRGRALYPLIYDHLRLRLEMSPREMSSKEARETLRFFGLEYLGKDENSECVRYVQRFITAHRQLAALCLIRRQIQKTLADIDFASDEVVALPNCHVTVGWADVHNLGRWSDNLRHRLQLGSVDQGREQKTRFRLPDQIDWKWPVGHSVNPKIHKLIGPVVKAARRAAQGGRAKR